MLRPEPTRIEPVFSPRIWGTRSLAPLFPDKTNLPEPIGEAWLTGLDCRIATGPFAGKTLGEAWREMPAEWRGTRLASAAQFPLLVKFIFPNDKLSIQVHPDDAYAAAHEQAAGSRGKTEMWYAVSAEPGAKVLIGLKPGVTKERFLAALDDHSLEDLFQSHSVHAGDTFFIPAGTPHTIGPGMVLCEVQQYSDLTYRLYDYGRVDANGKPRELHLEKALEVINFNSDAGGRVNTHVGSIHGTTRFEELVDCRYFTSFKIEFAEHMHDRVTKPLNEFRLWIFLEGEGEIGWSSNSHDNLTGNSGAFSYKQGDCWFIPAEFGSRGYYPKKKTGVLIASPLNPNHRPKQDGHED